MDPSSAHVYDVFLSFRGKDTRYTFTSHLRKALYNKKINTYIDYNLDRGHEIGPSLLKAIEESRIAVIILSENYAFSTWCLDELLHIVECKNRHQQLVIPIFYGIDASVVRHQRESYAPAFKWREALKTVANLSGFGSNTASDDSKLVEVVVKEILTKLNSEYSCDLTGLVGMESRILQIESLLDIDARNVCVRTVGIWGMGGIGKTALAGAVFNQFSSQFEASCFLANVREESHKCGLKHLRNELVAKLLKEESKNAATPYIGSTFVKKRIFHSKVLIVLDDMNDVSQLELLVGDQVQFGSGSRIIITTRDMHQLREMQLLRKAADHDVLIYKMEELNHDEALELFHWNDSKEISSGADYLRLLRRVVHYAAGIPLALKIWGSLFRRCKSKQEQNSFLEKLKAVPDQKLQDVFRVSYDALGKNEKVIFLDIACFHKNRVIDDVKAELDACGLFADIGIQVLIDMSLISIKGGCLWMHDVVQEMGWEIVCSECHGDPGKRSRLYIPGDIRYVFENNTGTYHIQSMTLLNLSNGRCINFPPLAFQKMHNLKYLKVSSVMMNFERTFSVGDLDSLPDFLRYLWWFKYPLNSLPAKFSPDNLVELSMRGSRLQRLWNEGQSPRNLKCIDLCKSLQLVEVPDLSKSVNIEKISLQFCIELVEVPSYFKNLFKLTYLNLNFCLKLRVVSKLPHNMEILLLACTAIEQVPSSIWSLEKLVRLEIGFCKGINLPTNSMSLLLHMQSSTFCPRLVSEHNCSGKLTFLNELLGNGCSRIKYSLDLLKPVESVEELYLARADIKEIPSSIDNLVGIKRLSLSGCKSLESIPTSIYNLKLLEVFNVDGCLRLKELPPCSVQLWSSMRELNFRNCGSLEQIPDCIFSLTSLKALILSGTMIISIPPTIKQASALRYLYLSNCKHLKCLPELPYLLELDLNLCTKLKTVSRSMNAHVQGLDQNPAYYRLPDCREKHIYGGCVSLNENARSNIMNDAQIRIMRTATACHRFKHKLRNHGGPLVTTVCWGNEIPRWLTYRTEGCSLKIKLPLNWCDEANFLSLALCAVVMVDDQDSPKCKCDSIFTTINGESHRASYYAFPWDITTRMESHVVTSDHVVIWYTNLSYIPSMFHNATEASFDFFPGSCGKACSNVKRCGVCLLYTELSQLTEGHSLDTLKCKVIDQVVEAS